jgi:hypothetical protein
MTPEEIVRALAESDPIADSDARAFHWCVLCAAGTPLVVADHAPTCPWRLAVKHVAALDGLAERKA